MKHAFILISFISLTFFSHAHAQSVSWDLHTDYEVIPPGADVRIDIFIDASESMNAFEAALEFDPAIATFQGFDDSRSIVDVWVKRPIEESPGMVRLVGGVQNGFQGIRGLIGTVHIDAREEGDLTVTLIEAHAYAADGKGTELQAVRDEIIIDVREGAVLPSYESAEDNESPEVEFVDFLQNPFEGKERFVGYSVRDQETGIRSVEARTLAWFTWSAWAPAENPVRVDKNAWAVGIRAFDNSGNLSARMIYYWPAFMRTVFPVGALLLFILFAFIHYIVRRRRAVTH